MEYLLKGSIFLVANDRYISIYTVSFIWVVLLNFIESQKNEIYLFYFILKN